MVRFSRGDISVQQRDAAIRWALKGWRTFLKHWNFKMKRFNAMSESDIVPKRRYSGARAFLTSFVKQARTMVSLL